MSERARYKPFPLLTKIAQKAIQGDIDALRWLEEHNLFEIRWEHGSYTLFWNSELAKASKFLEKDVIS